MNHSIKAGVSMVAACLLFVLASLSVKATELPLEHFLKKSDYLDMKMSPDGKHYAARIRDDQKVYLLIVNMASGEVVGGVSPGEDNEVSSVIWANNERLIYTFAEKWRRRDSAGYTGELFAVNVDSSNNKMLAGYRADDSQAGQRIKYQKSSKATHRVLNTLPEDDRKVLIIEYPWSMHGGAYYDDRLSLPVVSKLDIHTGKKSNKEIIPFRDARVLATDQGQVNFLTYVDEHDKIRAYHRPSKKKEWQEITEAFSDGLQGLSAEEITKDGKKVIFKGRLANDKAKTLYEFNLESNQLTRLFETDLDISWWQQDENHEPYVGVTYPNNMKFTYVEGRETTLEAKQHQSLVRAFKGRDIELLSRTQDRSKLILKASNSVNPGEYYLFDVTTNKADFLWANYSWIDPRTMRAKKAIEVTARDGKLLHGYLTMPAGSSADNKAPLVVFPHGGPHGVRDYPEFDYAVQLLANRGYAVLQINFRGSGGYTKEFRRAGYEQWGGVMVDDIIDATKWAAELDDISGSQTCIYGASYGGYAAMMSAVKAPDLYRCVIGYVGVYDLEAMLEKGDIPLGFGGKEYLARVLGTDREKMRAQSPVHLADKISAKVFLIHGDKDERVPSYHSKEMRSALKANDNDPQWLYLGNVGHGAGSLKNQMTVYSQILSFLDENIGKK